LWGKKEPPGEASVSVWAQSAGVWNGTEDRALPKSAVVTTTFAAVTVAAAVRTVCGRLRVVF
jgi:hypothetical protein